VNPAHLHLILNHFPPIGVPIGLVILLVGLMRHNETLVRTALVLFVALAAITVPVHMTGEPAEEIVEGLAGVSGQAIEAHEDAAFIGLLTTAALGAGSLIALLAMRQRRPVARALGYGIVALAVVSAGTLTWVANLGGEIRHSEIRSGAPPSGKTAKPRETQDDSQKSGRVWGSGEHDERE